MLKQTNILDPVQRTLDPEVFDEAGADKPRLIPSHRDWIKRQVHKVLRRYNHPVKLHHLVLTGSLTTYQYSPDSDCDVSLFTNIRGEERGHLIAVVVGHLDGTILPGTTHPMQMFVVPPGIDVKHLYHTGLRSGYDLLADRWIVPPEHQRVYDVEREDNRSYIFALESADKMERLLRFDPPKAVQYWHQIHDRRRREQRAGKGDGSQSNVVYKMLAQRGLFPKLEEASGEHIASADIPKVIYQKFRPDPVHPPIDAAARAHMPWVYSPKHNTIFLGPPGGYHWQLIQKVPEIKDDYGNDAWKQAPNVSNTPNVHGRMFWPDKEVLSSGDGDPETLELIARGLGGTYKPDEPLPESLEWELD